jgi:hypothetical protein
MLFPIVILVLTLSPVLIPTLVTAFHLVADRRRNSRELVTVVRGPITALATEARAGAHGRQRHAADAGVLQFDIDSPTAERWEGVPNHKASGLKAVNV